MKNYFKILKLPANADTAQIQRAIKQAAQTQSIDLALLQEMVSVFRDAEKRAAYLRALRAAEPDFFQSHQARPHNPSQSPTPHNNARSNSNQARSAKKTEPQSISEKSFLPHFLHFQEDTQRLILWTCFGFMGLGLALPWVSYSPPDLPNASASYFAFKYPWMWVLAVGLIFNIYQSLRYDWHDKFTTAILMIQSLPIVLILWLFRQKITGEAIYYGMGSYLLLVAAIGLIFTGIIWKKEE